jgi:hypothetical protein
MFSTNASEMARKAARDYEDLLQVSESRPSLFSHLAELPEVLPTRI